MQSPRLIALLVTLCAALAVPLHAQGGGDCTRTSVGLTPIDDLGAGEYRGEVGGLYPGGSNARPEAHEAFGRALADGIRPLDAAGEPDPNGRYVLLSLGMSNTTQEFSTFKPMADADPARDPRLVIVDGAQGGVTAADWANPAHPAWNTVNQRLAQAGVTPQQVAVAWVKMANRQPQSGWPAYAEELRGHLGTIASHLATKFPNLELAYHSSRIYAGYASSTLNPEPYAYESGFSVKWLIRDQLAGDPALNHDPARGPVTAPWLSWGPYLWADGLNPRSDGLTWQCADFANDGTHPAASGRQKVAQMLLDFFKSDTTASLWFTASAGFTDAAGDANFLNDQGNGELGVSEEGPDTRPLSIDSADLVSARYETTYRVEKDRDEDGGVVLVRHVPTGLRVRVRTTGPAAPSFGPTVGHELWVNVGTCGLVFRMYVRGALSQPDEPSQRAELVARDGQCAGGAKTYTDDVSVSFQGNEAVLEYPFDALGGLLGPGMVISPDSEGRGARIATVHRPSASAPLVTGPVVDVAAPSTSFAIGSDVPPDVDCRSTPANPACEEG